MQKIISSVTFYSQSGSLVGSASWTCPFEMYVHRRIYKGIEPLSPETISGDIFLRED